MPYFFILDALNKHGNLLKFAASGRQPRLARVRQLGQEAEVTRKLFRRYAVALTVVLTLLLIALNRTSF